MLTLDAASVMTSTSGSNLSTWSPGCFSHLNAMHALGDGLAYGLAPIARDSGRFRGARVCWGGRASVRAALYMPMRSNPIIKEFYARLVAAGKPARSPACTSSDDPERHAPAWRPVPIALSLSKGPTNGLRGLPVSPFRYC